MAHRPQVVARAIVTVVGAEKGARVQGRFSIDGKAPQDDSQEIRGGAAELKAVFPIGTIGRTLRFEVTGVSKGDKNYPFWPRSGQETEIEDPAARPSKVEVAFAKKKVSVWVKNAYEAGVGAVTVVGKVTFTGTGVVGEEPVEEPTDADGKLEVPTRKSAVYDFEISRVEKDGRVFTLTRPVTRSKKPRAYPLRRR